jgi:hypothetical protein
VTVYKLDPVGFREHLLKAEFMVAEMRKRAERGVEFARAEAPEHTGHFKESLSSDVKRDGGIHGDRAEGIVSSSDDAALSIEFGHTTTEGHQVEGHYTLTRTLDVMK